MTREEKQKAIDVLKISAPIMAVTPEEFKDYIQSLNKIMDWLEQEPKTGHWIELENWFTTGIRVKCSKCGQIFIVGDEVSRKYCSNCGADMREVEE